MNRVVTNAWIYMSLSIYIQEEGEEEAEEDAEVH